MSKSYLAILIAFLLLLLTNIQVRALECENLGINEKIECLKKETEKLNNQSKTLSSQVQQFD